MNTVCKEHEWVNVEDCLPEVGEKVITFPYSMITIRYIKTEYGDTRWFFNSLPVTHWQPLPSPPNTIELIEKELDKNLANKTEMVNMLIDNNLQIVGKCEHEWKEISFLKYNMYPSGIVTYCKKCGIQKDKIDFKIKDNLEVINKQQWEDILVEFSKLEYFDKIKSYEMYDAFVDWISENYTAPEKK